MPAYIGTSGWSYKHWKGVFYPAEVKTDEWLEYYVSRFPTVELNNTFYHLPLASTWEGWRERTPPDFRFAVKASRYITHIQRLGDAVEPLRRFFDGALRLEEKLGVVLFQLPPSMKRDVGLLRVFLQDARDRGGARARLAFELRDPSWLSKEVYSILKDHNGALAFADWGGEGPMEPVTADFVYVRRHGPRGDGRKPYPPDMIAYDGHAVLDWLSRGLDVFAYYNNDYGGYAVQNAEDLTHYVAHEPAHGQ